MLKTLMIVVMTMNHRTVVRVGQRLALILSCQCEEELNHEVNLFVGQLDTALIQTHVIHCLLKGVACAVMIVWPSVLDVAKARHLEAMTVTLETSLLEAAIILNSEFLSPICEVMSAESHEFVRLSAEVVADVACCAVILFEEFITGKFLCCDRLVVAKKPLVEACIRSNESALELLDRVCDVSLGKTVRIYCSESTCKVLVSLELCDDVLE